MDEEERTSDGTRIRDRFTDDRPNGTVVGTVGPEGARRLGVDVEGLMAIDNGALRMSPACPAGMGPAGDRLRPVRADAGTGLLGPRAQRPQASQTFYFPETARQRLRRMVSDIRHRRPRRQHHYENLAVGLFPGPAVEDPLRTLTAS